MGALKSIGKNVSYLMKSILAHTVDIELGLLEVLKIIFQSFTQIRKVNLALNVWNVIMLERLAVIWEVTWKLARKLMKFMHVTYVDTEVELHLVWLYTWNLFILNSDENISSVKGMIFFSMEYLASSTYCVLLKNISLGKQFVQFLITRLKVSESLIKKLFYRENLLVFYLDSYLYVLSIIKYVIYQISDVITRLRIKAALTAM